MNIDLYNYQEKVKKQGSKKMRKDKKALQKIIKDLIIRRQQHQIRINKLLDPNYHHQDITKTSQRHHYNQFSEMLKKLEVDEPHLQESIGSLGNHVNLLATVSLKTQYFLSEKQNNKEEGQLYQSILNRFGKKIIKYDFHQQKPKGLPLWLQQLTKYLLKEDLANGLFAVSQGQKGEQDYYGTSFMRGKYQQILLSKQQIDHQQINLVFSPSQQPQVNISYLLLWRLLQSKSNLTLPIAINRLFSFPYKKFNIRQSLELIKMNQVLNVIQKENQEKQRQKTLKIYGVQQTGKMEQISIQKSKNFSNYIPLVHHYESILIMNQIQFPVKSIPLSCLKHHFVVVTLIAKQKDYYYINIGSKDDKQRFKVSLLDFQGNLVQFDIINNGQFMLCQLAQEQYELYISPEGMKAEQNDLDQSYELVKQKQQQFWLWVQGKSVCSKQGDLQLQIRLKQQYNSYTIQIANKYIKQYNKQQQDMAQADTVIVKRHILRMMDLVVDKFITSTKSKIVVKYQHYNLCDQYFQDNTVLIKPNDSVALREQTQIDSITSSDGPASKLSFKILYFFH